MRFVEIDGKRYAWRQILQLRREQKKAARQPESPLFPDLPDDCRPASQRRADGRYSEPTLFDEVKA